MQLFCYNYEIGRPWSQKLITLPLYCVILGEGHRFGFPAGFLLFSKHLMISVDILCITQFRGVCLSLFFLPFTLVNRFSFVKGLRNREKKPARLTNLKVIFTLFLTTWTTTDWFEKGRFSETNPNMIRMTDDNLLQKIATWTFCEHVSVFI